MTSESQRVGFVDWVVGLARHRETALIVAMVGICLEWLAATWDIAWHYQLGRDHFLTPPHAAMVAGGVILGVGPGLTAAIAERKLGAINLVDRPLLGLASTAAALQGVSLVVDNWWHNTFGVDVTLWSPPHLALIFLWWMAVVALIGDYMRGPHRPRLLAGWIGLLLATTTMIVSEYDFGGSHFRVVWIAPILGALTIGALTWARRVTGLAWAATIAATVAVGARLVPVGLNTLLGREAPGWPIGILAAGVVVDVVHRAARSVWVAALAGWVALFAVEAPWLRLTGRTWFTGPLLAPAFVLGVGGAALGVVVGLGLASRPARRGTVVAALGLVVVTVLAAGALNPAHALPRSIAATVSNAGTHYTVAIPGATHGDWVSVFSTSHPLGIDWNAAFVTHGPVFSGTWQPGRLAGVWFQHGDKSWTGRFYAARSGDVVRTVYLIRDSARAPHHVAGWLAPFAYLLVVALLVGYGVVLRRRLNG